MTRIPANPRLGFDPSAHNVRRDLAMADQIVADQRSIGETVGEAAPGADDASAVRSSEETVSEMIVFIGGPWDGKTMAWNGGEIIDLVESAYDNLSIAAVMEPAPVLYPKTHRYRRDADGGPGFIYQGLTQ